MKHFTKKISPPQNGKEWIGLVLGFVFVYTKVQMTQSSANTSIWWFIIIYGGIIGLTPITIFFERAIRSAQKTCPPRFSTNFNLNT